MDEQLQVHQVLANSGRSLKESCEFKVGPERAVQLREAVDRELKLVADIQRSLLPTELPRIPTMELAAYYQAAHWAGGDYYNFFTLPRGRWGILIADVSGHDASAVVLTAILHSLAHVYPGPLTLPGQLLRFVNQHLATHYAADCCPFITAFYGVYDPRQRALTYANAGHHPPRIKGCKFATVSSLNGARNLPMGLSVGEQYEECTQVLRPGDLLVLYTDGITEATNPAGELFGLKRLDDLLASCRTNPTCVMNTVLASVEQFAAGEPPTDDRTLVVAAIS